MGQMNLSIKQKQAHRHRKTDFWLSGGRVGRRGMEWKCGVTRCTLFRMSKQEDPTV